MKTIHLDGKWQLKPVNSQETAVHTDWFLQHDFVPAMLPGDIHTALIKASVIPDPYYGMNEQSVQWVGSCDWMLSKDITVKKDFLEGQQFISLEFADTIFKLYINGIEAGTGNNMFRKWRFNVTGMLHVGKILLHLFLNPQPDTLRQKHLDCRIRYRTVNIRYVPPTAT